METTSEKLRKGQKMIPKIGMGKVIKMNSTHWILAQVEDSKICLVSQVVGNRYRNPVEVKDINRLSEKEWTAISGKTAKDLRRILREGTTMAFVPKTCKKKKALAS